MSIANLLTNNNLHIFCENISCIDNCNIGGNVTFNDCDATMAHIGELHANSLEVTSIVCDTITINSIDVSGNIKCDSLDVTNNINTNDIHTSSLSSQIGSINELHCVTEYVDDNYITLNKQGIVLAGKSNEVISPILTMTSQNPIGAGSAIQLYPSTNTDSYLNIGASYLRGIPVVGSGGLLHIQDMNNNETLNINTITKNTNLFGVLDMNNHNINNVADISCHTLNYDTLNPPIDTTQLASSGYVYFFNYNTTDTETGYKVFSPETQTDPLVTVPFSIGNGVTDLNIGNFITQFGYPNTTQINPGEFQFQIYSDCNTQNAVKIYVKMYKWDGVVETLLYTSGLSPYLTTTNTSLNFSLFTNTNLLNLTDRIIIKFYANNYHGGSINCNFYTYDGSYSHVHTTFLQGISWNPSPTVSGDIYYNGGKVGIGINTPTKLLEVNGTGKFNEINVPSLGGSGGEITLLSGINCNNKPLYNILTLQSGPATLDSVVTNSIARSGLLDLNITSNVDLNAKDLKNVETFRTANDISKKFNFYNTSTSYQMTLPQTGGTLRQVLTTDAGGVTSWTSQYFVSAYYSTNFTNIANNWTTIFNQTLLLAYANNFTINSPSAGQITFNGLASKYFQVTINIKAQSNINGALIGCALARNGTIYNPSVCNSILSNSTNVEITSTFIIFLSAGDILTLPLASSQIASGLGLFVVALGVYTAPCLKITISELF